MRGFAGVSQICDAGFAGGDKRRPPSCCSRPSAFAGGLLFRLSGVWKVNDLLIGYSRFTIDAFF